MRRCWARTVCKAGKEAAARSGCGTVVAGRSKSGRGRAKDDVAAAAVVKSAAVIAGTEAVGIGGAEVAKRCAGRRLAASGCRVDTRYSEPDFAAVAGDFDMVDIPNAFLSLE